MKRKTKKSTAPCWKNSTVAGVTVLVVTAAIAAATETGIFEKNTEQKVPQAQSQAPQKQMQQKAKGDDLKAFLPKFKNCEVGAVFQGKQKLLIPFMTADVINRIEIIEKKNGTCSYSQKLIDVLAVDMGMIEEMAMESGDPEEIRGLIEQNLNMRKQIKEGTPDMKCSGTPEGIIGYLTDYMNGDMSSSDTRINCDVL